MPVKRCQWCGDSIRLMRDYHDKDWGTPEHKDNKLFEMLILEGAQAELSWNTILNRRKTYRKAFDNFDPKKVSKYTQKDVERLLKDVGIIRNKLKVHSIINNAKIFLKIQKEFGSFNKYVWEFVDNKPIDNKIKKMKDIKYSTEMSDKLSKDLKKRGMNFIGPGIMYAFVQSIGMVNDHETNCFRYKQVKKLK